MLSCMLEILADEIYLLAVMSSLLSGYGQHDVRYIGTFISPFHPIQGTHIPPTLRYIESGSPF